MSLIVNNHFITPIYFEEKKEWVQKLNLISDKYIEEAIEKNRQFFKQNKDFGFAHHSGSLTSDSNFLEFLQYINSTAYNILDSQEFDLSNHSLVTTDLWVQEFSKLGGGYHTPHTHWNGHISGFYFLKCSNDTSYPTFHDPRAGRIMNLLPEKNRDKITMASSSIFYKLEAGTFVFFNSSLQHEFPVDHGIEPFRFIHFNIQAFPKQLISK